MSLITPLSEQCCRPSKNYYYRTMHDFYSESYSQPVDPRFQDGPNASEPYPGTNSMTSKFCSSPILWGGEQAGLCGRTVKQRNINISIPLVSVLNHNDLTMAISNGWHTRQAGAIYHFTGNPEVTAELQLSLCDLWSTVLLKSPDSTSHAGSCQAPANTFWSFTNDIFQKQS